MGLFGKKKEVYPKIYKDIYVVAGLDIPQECKCTVELNETDLIINALGKEYILNISKITNLQYKLDIDIEKHEENGSVLKGIIGGVTFGIPGAIIGCSPKTKEKRLVTCVDLISYESQNGLITIVLMGEPNTHDCPKLYDTLKPMITVRNQRIEL